MDMVSKLPTPLQDLKAGLRFKKLCLFLTSQKCYSLGLSKLGRCFYSKMLAY